MKVIADKDIVRQRINIYVELGGDGYQRVFAVNDGESMVVPNGGEPPLYMTIPWNIAEAVGEALAPRPEASARHLDDAIEVRDRLLTLVEKRPTTVIVPASTEIVMDDRHMDNPR